MSPASRTQKPREHNPHPLTKFSASDRKRNKREMDLAAYLVKLREQRGEPFRTAGTLICMYPTVFALERAVYELTGERP